MSTEQLELETEATRAQLARTLDELRTMTPGRVVDELLDYAKDGGGEFLRNFGKQISEHPLPATLIGAGIVWFMMDKGKTNGATTSNETGRGIMECVSDTVGSVTSTVGSPIQTGETMAERAGDALNSTIKSAIGSLSEVASSAASSIGGAATSAVDAVTETASDTAAAVKNTAASALKSASALEERAVASGRSVMDFCMSQPLILTGLGLAIGAALGAAIPETKAEDELMGEAADAVKDSAMKIASEQLAAAKAVGEHVVEELAKLVSEKASDTVERLQDATENANPDAADETGVTTDRLPSDERQDSQTGTPGGSGRTWEQSQFH